MKILFFTEQSPYTGARVGGAENSMRLMAEGLAARGHEVIFASLRPDMIPTPRRFSQNGVEIRLFPDIRYSLPQKALRKFGAPGRQLAEKIMQKGWDWLAKWLFSEKFDLLYAFYEMDFLTRALAAREAGHGPKIVMRMAGMGWHDTLQKEPDKAARMRAVFGAVDAINYLSPRSRAQIEAAARGMDIPLDRPQAIDADIGVDVGAVPRLWTGPGTGAGLDLVVATRFSANQKRQDILIEALGLLRGKLDFSLTMIGTGVTRDAIAARRDALGLQDNVEIIPFMDQAQLWERLKRADLLCHPCDHEGVSKIILEAMMLGLPVLASDVEPLPDYVIEGETGLRVANTPQAWADKLAALAADKSALPGLSARARNFVEDHYDRSRNIERYETAFARLLGETSVS